MSGDDRPLIFLGVDIGKSAHYAVAVESGWANGVFKAGRQ